MGGDNAPREIVHGALMAAREYKIEPVLVGRKEEILSVSESHPEYADIESTVIDAREVVTMDDNPASVMQEKKDASMTVALRALANGEGDALVSAGSTGALLIQSTLIAKRIKGIRRAALSPLLPTENGKALLIDCGANAECTPEYLLQFAYMGAYYMENVFNVKNPRVGLLNIGTEPHKGDKLRQAAFELLSGTGERINFIGNIESRDVLYGAADVIVTDGFTGNILLKAIEGAGLYFARELKGIFMKSVLTKLSALMVSGGIRGFKRKFDYNETGGAPLLGISKPVIKAHGSANAVAFKNAIGQAYEFVNTGIIGKIEKDIGFMTEG
jgi:glycerol-3-phosphate acyltransferase PlsX